MKNNIKKIVMLLACWGVQANTQASEAGVDLGNPEHGKLSFEAGSGVVLATPDSGYLMDTLYSEVPGVWGVGYIESMVNTFEVVEERDTTINALFLPESEFSGFTVIQDVVFAQPGIKPLKYDVWSPTGARNLPMVVIIHGGGWISNTEDIMRGMAREIVRTGKYVVLSVDYRWAENADGDETGNSMADIIGDVFGAVAHIQEHAAEYGGDATRIAVTGDSAGGHLSAVVATMPEMIGAGGFGETAGVFEFMPSYLPTGKSVEQVRGEIINAVKVAAPSYGVFSSDSEGMANLSHFSSDPAADATWAAAIAPIQHIPNASVREIPQYFVRGTEDFLIQNAMVQDFVDALKAKGHRAQYDQVEGAGHAFFDWKPDQQTRDTFSKFGLPYIASMVKFFDSVFYP